MPPSKAVRGSFQTGSQKTPIETIIGWKLSYRLIKINRSGQMNYSLPERTKSEPTNSKLVTGEVKYFFSHVQLLAIAIIQVRRQFKRKKYSTLLSIYKSHRNATRRCFWIGHRKNFKSRRAAILDSISSPGCDCLLRLSLGPGDLRDMQRYNMRCNFYSFEKFKQKILKHFLSVHLELWPLYCP